MKHKFKKKKKGHKSKIKSSNLEKFTEFMSNTAHEFQEKSNTVITAALFSCKAANELSAVPLRCAQHALSTGQRVLKSGAKIALG